MKSSSALIATMLLLFAQELSAQNDADALRYSQLNHGFSTARSAASGGAYGALGGDFSSVGINPAGLGVYRSSELSLGLGFHFQSADNFYLGSTVQSQRANFNIPNLGLVISSREKSVRGLRPVHTNFAIGLNRTANYHEEINYEGFNADHSLLDNYLEFLNDGSGTNPSDVFNSDPFGAGLAWETYLLNPLDGDSTQYNSVISDGGVLQGKTISRRGAQQDLVLGVATNLGHKIYVGGSINIPFLRFDEDTYWTEEDENQSYRDFESFTLSNRLRTTGTGINFKIGVLAKPHKSVRLGASVHSPTWFRMTDGYSSEMWSSLDSSGEYYYASPSGRFDYNLQTPWRVTGSIALVASKLGFISLDYEYLDFSSASFDFRGIANSVQNSINETIDNKYQSSGTLRAGAELKLDNWRLRGGYAMAGTPFAPGRAAGEQDFSETRYTGGIGYRSEYFFVDFAYIHAERKQYDLPYDLVDESQTVDGASVQNNSGTGILTMGVRF